MKISEFKINNYSDRHTLVSILAEAGYKVWIEKREEHNSNKTDYFVIVETKEVKNEEANGCLCDLWKKRLEDAVKEIDRLNTLVGDDHLEAIRERAIKAGMNESQVKHTLAFIEHEIKLFERLIDEFESQWQSKEGE